MDENKKEKYTFGPEEKDILNILASFENELGMKLQESKSEIEQIKYYENFEIDGTNDCEILGVFFTKEKDVDGNISYHLYYRDSSNEIFSIDNEGNIQIDPKWGEVIGEIDLESTMSKNDAEQGRLKGISERLEPEELEKKLERNETNKDKENEEIDKGPDEETQEIEKDLQEQGEDLRITKYKQIKDPHIKDRIPEVFQEGTENGIAYSNKLNRFVIISKVNGQYQLNENIEPGKLLGGA